MKKNLIRTILFCGLFYVINLGIGFILANPHQRLVQKNKAFGHSMGVDFLAQPDYSLDMFFLGSSHSYRSFDPEIFDGLLKSHSFNLGTPSQCPVTSYYVLKQALKTQKPKAVILETFWFPMVSQDQFSNAFLAFRFVHSMDVRFGFFSKGFDLKGKLILFFPSYFFRNNLEDTVRLSLGRDLKEVDDGTYKTKGYVESTKIVSLEELNKKNRFDGWHFSKAKMDDKQIQYIQEIVELCRRQHIAIVFVTSPMPRITLDKVETYKDIHEYINHLSLKWQVPYIDGNTDVPEGFFNINDFSDEDHLNNKGVQKFDAYVVTRLKALNR